MGDFVLGTGNKAGMDMLAPASLPRGHSWLRTASGSALAHAVVLVAVSLAVLSPLRTPQDASAVALVFAAPAPVTVPTAAPVVPQPAPLVEAATPVQPPVRVAAPPVNQAARPAARTGHRQPRPEREVPPHQAVTTAEAPPPAVPVQPSPAPTVSPELVAGLKARIQRAVQEAAVYPPAAKLMHREGRAQIRFDYQDGAVKAVALAQSSRNAMLDDAAVAAVLRAAYPRAPVEIERTSLALLVWVNFGMVSQE